MGKSITRYRSNNLIREQLNRDLRLSMVGLKTKGDNQRGLAVQGCYGNSSRLSFTRSRISLPGLKWGTNLPSSSTDSPVLGLRPVRGAR